MKKNSLFLILLLIIYSCTKDTTNQNDKVYDIDLSLNGTANCYIISATNAFYKFPTVKGNSNEPVGNVKSVEVLWESFGTDVYPEKGDLISDVKLLEDGYVSFKSKERKGNAVVAVKDSSGEILWSWHLWLTDKPKDQIYNNAAGVMMDRNLGALSNEKGSAGALGLLYQWGRKDPFLGSSSTLDNIPAKSTIVWPSPVPSSQKTGTMIFTIKNPTVFIVTDDEKYDWYTNFLKERWGDDKTIYDPCPPGYRIPYSIRNNSCNRNVWADAFAVFGFDGMYDNINKGMEFGTQSDNKTLSQEANCWYPAAGYINASNGILSGVGTDGNYWSIRYAMSFDEMGNVSTDDIFVKYSNAVSVRCIKEF